MKALRYYGAHDIRYESMDDPTPQSDRDAIVKVTACAICGSDLHIYHGHGFSEDVGFCVGHEAVGEVVETGRGVSRLKVGDKVMIPAAVGCGSCRQCANTTSSHACTVTGRCSSGTAARSSLIRRAGPLGPPTTPGAPAAAAGAPTGAASPGSTAASRGGPSPS